MANVNMVWTDFKTVVTANDPNLNIKCVDTNGNYYLYAFDGPMEYNCVLIKDSGDDQTDFETNFKSVVNKVLAPQVTTQYELNNKDLKLARIAGTVSGVDGIGKSICYISVPGTFGQAGVGRYVAGGYAVLDSYDIDDFVTVDVEDKDRIIATIYGGGTPLSDSDMIAQGDYPNYPVVKSYTDDEQPSLDNMGWYFWPLAMGSTLPPVGECEIEPIGGYGFVPAGFYVKLTITRPNLTSGRVRICIYWAKPSVQSV